MRGCLSVTRILRPFEVKVSPTNRATAEAEDAMIGDIALARPSTTATADTDHFDRVVSIFPPIMDSVVPNVMMLPLQNQFSLTDHATLCKL